MMPSIPILVALTVALLPAATLVPDPARPFYTAVVYAPWVDPTAYEWHAEVSPDLKRWFYFYQFENSPTIQIPIFPTNTFVRLVGVPWPTQ